ncbi:uncharacterized protein LOC109860140 isoform X1 [Pseudomyrmex gracilis]|uniref:uncharacterized protein LOC109860140 isoform X1 n=1 Tax=Pseudomyrmex gracilis TaxID=219809 RepID=UPI0009952D2B|nr:uncharacterized protein LOC109860140 isoform X1 [Pseudomyrmex gracilis]
MCVNTFVISTLITGISVFCYYILNDENSDNNNDDNKNQTDIEKNQTILKENQMILKPSRKLREEQNNEVNSPDSQDHVKMYVKPRDNSHLLVITRVQDATLLNTLFSSEQNIIASTLISQPSGLAATSSQSNNVQYDKSRSSIERHDKTQYKDIPSTFTCPHRLRQKSQTRVNKPSLFNKLTSLFKFRCFGSTFN